MSDDEDIEVEVLSSQDPVPKSSPQSGTSKTDGDEQTAMPSVRDRLAFFRNLEGSTSPGEGSPSSSS
eukprot:5555543-Pyramimonas_sp.AAC.1